MLSLFSCVVVAVAVAIYLSFLSFSGVDQYHSSRADKLLYSTDKYKYILHWSRVNYHENMVDDDDDE